MANESKKNFSRSLTATINSYWEAYKQYAETSDEGQFRSWSVLPEDIQVDVRNNCYKLIKMFVTVENLDDKSKGQLTENVIQFKWGNSTGNIVLWWDFDPGKDISREYPSFSPEGLLLIVTPNFNKREIGEYAIQLRKEKKTCLLLVSPEDVDSLAKQQWSLWELICFKFVKVFLEGGIDADGIYNDWQIKSFRDQLLERKSRDLVSLDSIKSTLIPSAKEVINHPLSDRVYHSLYSRSNIHLVGVSSSGKTWLALDVGTKINSSGIDVYYTDVGLLNTRKAYELGVKIFSDFINQTSYLVIFDDLHTQRSLGLSLVNFLSVLRSSTKRKDITYAALAWPELSQEINEISSGAVNFAINASDIKEKILDQFGGHIDKLKLADIAGMAGDDLYILRQALENTSSSSDVNVSNLASRIWEGRSKELKGNLLEFKVVLAAVYFIGQYECDVPINFIKKLLLVDDKTITELVKEKFLSRKGEMISPPHISFAKLMLILWKGDLTIWNWLEKNRNISSGEDILISYLEAIEPSQIWSTVKLVESSISKGLNKSTKANLSSVVSIWKSIDILLNKMEDQQKDDPSWGRAISSSFFACQAFGTVGKYQSATESLNFIRDCYYVSKGIMGIHINKLSTVTDFEQIRKRMEIEEREVSFPYDYSLELSSNIDINAMHTNWACGLALGAEAYMQSLDEEELSRLALAVEERVDKKAMWYFYPARVPWVTARVLTGLGLCGRTIHNSPTVRKVADWLLEHRKNGGAREGIYWLPGTDGWNTILETTSMVITALSDVGVPSNHPVIQQAQEWIISQKQNFVQPGNELNSASAVQAYLKVSNDWQGISREAIYISNWADSIALWRNATESAQKTNEQTCRAAKVAACLVSSLWPSLRSNLPKLIQEIGVESISINDEGKLVSNTISSKIIDDESEHIYEFDVALSYAVEDKDYVEKVARCLKRKGIKVFFDKYEVVELWGKDLYEHLSDVFQKKSKYCVMFLSEHYAQKNWTNHERRNAQARAFHENSEYILPVRLDNTETSGVLETVGYLDAKKYSPSEVCKIIQSKINSST